MKKSRIIWIIAAYTGVVLLFMGLTPKKIIWRDYFQADKRAPYGSFVLVEELDEIFDDFSIVEESLYTTLNDSTGNLGNYVFVTGDFYPSEKEISNLLAWVAQGNTAFISANSISSAILDTLNLGFDYGYFNFSELVEDQLKVNLSYEEKFDSETNYTFKKQTSINHFIELHDSLASSSKLSFISNQDGEEQAVLVSKDFGKGRFLLHSLPRAFTNYYMLHQNNHEYAAGVLSLLPQTKTRWDEYYKPSRREKAANLSVFLKTPSFKWAFYVGILLLFSFMLFKLKRNQRIIPIVKPPENRSLELTKTVGDLYFHTEDKKDLVQKMERHFKEYLREKYFVHNFKGTEEEINLLAVKSAKTVGLISTLHKSFKELQKDEVSNDKLIRLSQKLHIFYYGREQ